MTELKRCKCGGEPVLLRKPNLGTWVECENCEETTEAYDSTAAATIAWNARREGDGE
jgi:hypothetical protein